LVKWDSITVKLGDLKPWQRNPKTISKEHAKRLLSLWERLGQFQTIAIGPANEVYDGHQRLNVLMSAYGRDYEVMALQSSRALSEKEREELVVAAHIGTVGQFDWEQLSGWDAPELIAWGLDESTVRDWMCDISAVKNLLGSEGIDYDKEWQDMPELPDTPKAIRTIHIHFKSSNEVREFSQLLHIDITDKTSYIWFDKIKINES